MHSSNDALLIRSVRLAQDSGSPVDILVDEGKIAKIAPSIELSGTTVEHGGGALVLPGFVDTHCHVDKTVWGSPKWLSYSGGPSIAERSANNAIVREKWGIPSTVYTAALLAEMIKNGSSHIRTHMDVDPKLGLRAVEVVAEAVSRFHGQIDVEKVAFPQLGILSKPGTDALMREAVEMGVHAVGGIDPASRDSDPVRHIDAIFAIATKCGCKIDIHLHDRGSLGAWQMKLICERTRVEDMAGRVTISHAFALGEIDPSEQDRLIDLMAECGVSVSTAMPFNTPYLPLRRMVDRGVIVGLGNDSIRNTWSPYGTADMLARTMLIAHRSEFRSDEDIEFTLKLATQGGLELMGINGISGLQVGALADFSLVDAINSCDAVVRAPQRKLVVKSGNIVARDGILTQSVDMS